MSGVFQKAHAFIGDVEKDDRCAQDAARADDVQVEDVGHPYQQEDQHFPADALKPHGAGQLLIRNRTHHTRDVIDHHKSKQRVKQAIAAAKKVAEPAAYTSKDELNGVPKFLHETFLLFDFWYEKSSFP